MMKEYQRQLREELEVEEMQKLHEKVLTPLLTSHNCGNCYPVHSEICYRMRLIAMFQCYVCCQVILIFTCC